MDLAVGWGEVVEIYSDLGVRRHRFDWYPAAFPAACMVGVIVMGVCYA